MKKCKSLYGKLLIFQLIFITISVTVINLFCLNIDSLLWKILIVVGLMIPIGIVVGLLGRWYLIRANKKE